MTTGDALLTAIWERPHDDLPRLAYADWLDDRGDPARAEFIRVQCQLARLDPWDDGREPLERRDAALWRKGGKGWKAGLPDACQAGARFHRGFPAPRPQRVPSSRFADLPAAPFAAAPLWDYSFPEAPARLDRLLGCQHFRRVGRLGFFGWLRSPDVAARLVAAPNAVNVQELGAAGASDESLAVLADGADGLPHLTRLDIRWGPGDAGLRAVIGSRLAGRLRELDLSHCRLTADGLRELFSDPRPVALTHLALPELSDAVLADAVTDSRPAFHLRSLAVNFFSTQTLTRWVAWPELRSVRRLEVRMNDGGAFLRLAASPHLAGLRHLRLSLGGEPARVRQTLTGLADPTTLPALARLDLFGMGEWPGTDGVRARFGGRLTVR